MGFTVERTEAKTERQTHTPWGHQGDEKEMKNRRNSVEILLGQNRSTNRRGRVAAENIEGMLLSPEMNQENIL